LNILRFNEFRFSLLLRPYERDAVCKGAANHTQKQNSGGYLFHAMYYRTEGKSHKFISGYPTPCKASTAEPTNGGGDGLLIGDTWN